MQFQLISSVVAFAARSTVPHCVAHLPPRLNALPYAARSLPHLTALLCNVHPLPSIDCPTVWRIPYFIFNFAHLFVWEGVDRDCHSKCVRVPAPPSPPPKHSVPSSVVCPVTFFKIMAKRPGLPESPSLAGAEAVFWYGSSSYSSVNI